MALIYSVASVLKLLSARDGRRVGGDKKADFYEYLLLPYLQTLGSPLDRVCKSKLAGLNRSIFALDRVSKESMQAYICL